jgi:rod shape determining protein RodA
MGRNLNLRIWVFTACVVFMGLVVLYSASYENARVSVKVFYDQLYCAALGFTLMYVISRMDYRRFYDFAYIAYWIMLILLVLVMFKGRHALGAQRWFSIAGVSFQPSEIAKLGLILALGRYFSQRRPTFKFGTKSTRMALWNQLIAPLLLTGIPMMFIFKQPDLGTAILVFGIFVIMAYSSGMELRFFSGFGALCLIAAPFMWHVLRPYQKDRLLVFLNPNIDPLGAGYTIIQSKIAVGSGQFFGKGWLQGTQNLLNFLPEQHTDFIFSVVGEEWGFLGAILLLLAYGGLIITGLSIAEQVNDKFGTQVAIGIVGILALQVIINMGMVMGLFPVVGITLPMISYGRTSFMVFMLMMGILLSLSKRRTIF